MPMVDSAAFQAEQARRSQGGFAPFPPAPPAPPSPLAPPSGVTQPSVPPAPPKSRKTHPPVAILTVDWVDVDGVERKETLTIRILSFDEEVEIGRRAGHIAKVPWDRLPTEDQERIRALATCFVMWPGMSGDLQWQVSNDPLLGLRMAQEVTEHRMLYFRGYVREGAAAPRSPRLEVAFPPDQSP